MNDFSNINLNHPQQDVNKERPERQGMFRYHLAEQLLSPSPPGKSLLELGCGRLEIARRLRDMLFEVTVTDLSPMNIKYANQFGFTNYQLDLTHGLPVFRDNQFHVVIGLEIIEHIVSAEYLLQEIYRVLVPGGILILSTPNFAFFYNRLRIIAGKVSQDEGYHYRFFTISSLTKMLHEANLKDEAWLFSMPAFGINKIQRWMGSKQRKHITIPRVVATLFAQSMVVRACKVISRKNE